MGMIWGVDKEADAHVVHEALQEAAGQQQQVLAALRGQVHVGHDQERCQGDINALAVEDQGDANNNTAEGTQYRISAGGIIKPRCHAVPKLQSIAYMP